VDWRFDQNKGALPPRIMMNTGKTFKLSVWDTFRDATSGWMDAASRNVSSEDVKVATILGLGALTVIGSGMMPKIGPGRAITFAISSFLRGQPTPFSIRTKEMQELNRLLKSKVKGSYIVVVGVRGGGKSTLIDSALHNRMGVLSLHVSSNCDALLLQCVSYCFVVLW
jgi:hypothetical protein